MMVYNPINDIWNNFKVNRENSIFPYKRRLIIADGCLFFALYCYSNRYHKLTNKFISITKNKI